MIKFCLFWYVFFVLLIFFLRQNKFLLVPFLSGQNCVFLFNAATLGRVTAVTHNRPPTLFYTNIPKKSVLHHDLSIFPLWILHKCRKRETERTNEKKWKQTEFQYGHKCHSYWIRKYDVKAEANKKKVALAFEQLTLQASNRTRDKSDYKTWMNNNNNKRNTTSYSSTLAEKTIIFRMHRKICHEFRTRWIKSTITTPTQKIAKTEMCTNLVLSAFVLLSLGFSFHDFALKPTDRQSIVCLNESLSV